MQLREWSVHPNLSVLIHEIHSYVPITTYAKENISLQVCKIHLKLLQLAFCNVYKYVHTVMTLWDEYFTNEDFGEHSRFLFSRIC